ncbi:MAG: hypothetical protein ABI808_06885 [Pseudonocardiales bacterium]
MLHRPGGQAEAAAGLVPDWLFDFPFDEFPDEDDPSPELELDFSAGLDELDESPDAAAGVDFDGSDFVVDSESACLPAALRLSLR